MVTKAPICDRLAVLAVLAACNAITCHVCLVSTASLRKDRYQISSDKRLYRFLDFIQFQASDSDS